MRRLLLLAIIGGAALAAPLPVLDVTAEGEADRTLALDPGGGFTYEYRQSIYEVPVYEDFSHDRGRLRLRQVRSMSAAALEYFRWDSPVRRIDQDELAVEAPDVVTDELVIRVADQARQVLRLRPGSTFAVDRIGSDVVRVRAGWRPLIVWLPTWIGQLE